MRRYLAATLAAGVVVTAASQARADTFESGSIIIPMDTTYQDMGMLKAYGLVYQLLRNHIPVNWCIRSGKGALGVDFTASATALPGGQTINAHGYRGGPWVIRSTFAAEAKPIIAAWQAANVTVVHEASAQFEAPVARRLVVAPTIAMFADGNQKIARKYVQAAGIPDSTLSNAWADTSPDMLDPTEVAGPTTTNHRDGKLFDQDGDPVYCQFMSMHWGVNDARDNPEVVAEVRAFLGFPTHFFAECQAVNAYEDDLVNGLFLTTHGFKIDTQPATLDFYNQDSPYAQFDGTFQTVGGSEPSYSLPPGGSYKAGGITMITGANTPEGVRDVWMTGYLDGTCPPNQEVCNNLGKISYLGGHEYEVKLPISANPKTQGTRLFLNSLFEAQCATMAGQPQIMVEKTAPATTTSSTVTFQLDYWNAGPGIALQVTLEDALPPGSAFVSASNNGTLSGGTVSWDLDNLGAGESGTVSFTVTLSGHGVYENTANLDYRVGLNDFTLPSNTTSTLYDADTDGDGVLDSVDICPDDPNPNQNLLWDLDSCGTCGNVCDVDNGVAGCLNGVCSVVACGVEFSDCDGLYATGCEYANSSMQTDPANCGACGVVCDPPKASGACVGGACTVGTCDAGWADCNGLLADGCEYATTGFATDPNHCGDCATTCGAGYVCLSGVCGLAVCPAGTEDCVAPPGDCETNTLTSLDHCGGCSLLCAPANATGNCTGGVCSVASCSAGWADCNGLASDGCEYSTAGFLTDEGHCGGCGLVCNPFQAVGQCVDGACEIDWCKQGYDDCNGEAADGCEYETAGHLTDAVHCGACGNVCAPPNGTGACVAGVCGIGSCATGYVDLDGNYGNGCEYACTTTSGDEIACDGVDDDCDGVVDESYVASTCGVGVCQAQSTCVNGVEACTPAQASTEGPAGDTTCVDGVDNDCDGDVDDVDEDCDGGGGAAGAAGAAGSAGSAGAAGTAGTAGTAGVAGEGGTAGTGGSAGTGGTAGTGGSTGGSAGTGGSSGGLPAEESSDEGGCSCAVPAATSHHGFVWLVAGLAASLLRRRRRAA